MSCYHHPGRISCTSQLVSPADTTCKVFSRLICYNNFMRCHADTDQTCHFIQSQYTDTRPTSPNTDPIMPGAWHGSRRIQFFFKNQWHDLTFQCRKQSLDLRLWRCTLHHSTIKAVYTTDSTFSAETAEEHRNQQRPLCHNSETHNCMKFWCH